MPMKNVISVERTKGLVHCPICTHRVEADVMIEGKRTYAVPKQKCPRCSSSLDAAVVLDLLIAA